MYFPSFKCDSPIWILGMPSFPGYIYDSPLVPEMSLNLSNTHRLHGPSPRNFTGTTSRCDSPTVAEMSFIPFSNRNCADLDPHRHRSLVATMPWRLRCHCFHSAPVLYEPRALQRPRGYSPCCNSSLVVEVSLIPSSTRPQGTRPTLRG